MFQADQLEGHDLLGSARLPHRREERRLLRCVLGSTKNHVSMLYQLTGTQKHTSRMRVRAEGPYERSGSAIGG